jgi:hypothetical protein
MECGAIAKPQAGRAAFAPPCAEPDLFQEPVSTFWDHALGRPPGAMTFVHVLEEQSLEFLNGRIDFVATDTQAVNHDLQFGRCEFAFPILERTMVIIAQALDLTKGHAGLLQPYDMGDAVSVTAGE